MRLGLIVLGLTLGASISGCSTFQEGNILAGASASPLTDDTYRISAGGSAFTSADTVQDYALLRAAEVTLQSGHTYFQILNGVDTSSSGTISTPGQAYTTFAYNSAYTSYTPGTQFNYVKPGEDLMIRVFTPTPGQSLPPQSFPAQQIYDNISPRLHR